MLLGKPVTYLDMESVDAEYFKSLEWIMANDPEPLALTFEVDADQFGDIREVNLRPNGKDIPVTEDNKHEFVQLVTEWRLVKSVEEQSNRWVMWGEGGILVISSVVCCTTILTPPPVLCADSTPLCRRT